MGNFESNLLPNVASIGMRWPMLIILSTGHHCHHDPVRVSGLSSGSEAATSRQPAWLWWLWVRPLYRRRKTLTEIHSGLQMFLFYLNSFLLVYRTIERTDMWWHFKHIHTLIRLDTKVLVCWQLMNSQYLWQSVS